MREFPAAGGLGVNAPDDLRPGDILFYSPSDLVGVLIAIKTWTWLSHVECYIGRGRVIAARASGVKVYGERIDKHLVAIRRPDRFNLLEAHIAVGPMLGRPYEYAGFFSFILPLYHRRQASRICSSVATVFLRGGGCEPFNPELDADDVSPAQLWQTPALTTVWEKSKAR